jgi:biopolymer transport protein ExbB/TolQ
MQLFGSVATFMREGGPFMLLIFGVGLLIVAIAIERSFVIMRAGMVDGDKLTERVTAALRKGKPTEARALVARGSHPMLEIARTLLERPLSGEGYAAHERELIESYAQSSSVALAPIHRRLGYLMTLANVATLLGLLGTIFGLTHAFSGVGQADPAQRSAFLAAGISQAMNTTAFGLIVAIPTMALHSFLLAQVDGLCDRIEAAAGRLIQLLARHGNGNDSAVFEEVRRASVAVR